MIDSRLDYHQFVMGEDCQMIKNRPKTKFSSSCQTTTQNHHLNNNNGYVLRDRSSKKSTTTTKLEDCGNRRKSEEKSTLINNNNIGDNKTSIIKNEKSLIETEWEKVLYKRQGVPDNFVPKTFLKDLRKNVNLRRFHLMEVIVATSNVTQQILLIVILVLMFIYFDYFENRYDRVLFIIVSLVTFVLYSIVITCKKLQELVQVKSCLIILIACFTMSPVLKTLTETISTDTIYAQCTLMCIIHLAFNDYGLKAPIVSRPISLNAIFFTSVCLASRLSTTYHAFAFLIFSTDLFVLIALLYKQLSKLYRLLFTAMFLLVTFALMQFTFGWISLIASIMLFLFINIFCPCLFIRMQSLKENIYGPWDEAIIDQSKLKFSRTTQLLCSNKTTFYLNNNNNKNNAPLKTKTNIMANGKARAKIRTSSESSTENSCLTTTSILSTTSQQMDPRHFQYSL